jgi:hypothetical protein
MDGVQLPQMLDEPAVINGPDLVDQNIGIFFEPAGLGGKMNP